MATKILVLIFFSSFALSDLLADNPTKSDRYVVSGETSRAATVTDVMVTKSDRVFYEVEPLMASDDALMIRHRHGIITIPADDLSKAWRDLYAISEEAEDLSMIELDNPPDEKATAPGFSMISIHLSLSLIRYTPRYDFYPVINYHTLAHRNAILATVPGRAAAITHFLRVTGLNQGY